MRKLFLRLVDMTSPGAEARAVSRPTPLSDFVTPQEQQLISELVEEKLLVSDASLPPEKESPARGATVEIAHEALLSAWPMLKGWLEQAREIIYVRNRLSADARRFAELTSRAPARADEELWGGTRLAQAQELRSHGDFQTVLGGLTAEEESFLDASLRLREKREAEIRRARRLLAGGSVTVLLAIILGLGFGLREQRRRTQEAKQQFLNTYVEQGRQLLLEKKKPDEALLWLHRAQAGGSRHADLPELLKNALLRSLAPRSIFGDLEDPPPFLRIGTNIDEGATYSPDGRRILTWNEYEAKVWEADTGRMLLELDDHTYVASATYSPDSRCILTAQGNKTARVWEADTGRVLLELKGHEGSVINATYSPDSRRILTASSDKTARVWEADTGRMLLELKGHEGSVTRATYSPDSRRILTASSDKKARVWEADTGRMLLELKGHEGSVTSATYSPDSRRILTASGDNTARIWDAGTGRLLAELRGHEGHVNSAAYSTDNRRIVTASNDTTTRIWDADTGRPLAALRGHGWLKYDESFDEYQRRIITPRYEKGRVYSATYSPDGRHIVTTGERGATCVWDVTPEQRTPDEIAKLIRCYVPLRFDGDVIVWAKPNPAECKDAGTGTVLTK